MGGVRARRLTRPRAEHLAHAHARARRRQLASLLWKASVEQEVDAEFDFHVEMRTRELIERGMDPVAARAAAVARFGDIRAVNAVCRSIGNQRERDMRRTEYLSELALRRAIRGSTAHQGPDLHRRCRAHARARRRCDDGDFQRGRGGGAASRFRIPSPDRLVFAMTHWSFGDGGVSVGDYSDWRKRSKSFAELTAFNFLGVTMTNGETPDRITDAAVTASVFPTFGVKPQLGRVFTADEDQPGRNTVVVLSDGLWRRAFGASSDVVGKPITLGGVPHTIIGVMPASFDPTDSHEDLWTPGGFTPEQIAEHDEHFLTVVGRLAPGVTIASAAP